MTVGPQRRSSKDVIHSIDAALYGEKVAAQPKHEQIISRAFGPEASVRASGPGGYDMPLENRERISQGDEAWVNQPLQFRTGRHPTAREGRLIRGITPRSGEPRSSGVHPESDVKRTTATKGGAPARARKKAEFASSVGIPSNYRSVLDYPAHTTQRLPDSTVWTTKGNRGPAGPYQRATIGRGPQPGEPTVSPKGYRRGER